MSSALTGYALRVNLAAHHYLDLRIQIGTEAALCSTLQRFDVRREDLLLEACHHGRLPAEGELVGTEAW
jgi:hypothetical protein